MNKWRQHSQQSFPTNRTKVGDHVCLRCASAVRDWWVRAVCNCWLAKCQDQNYWGRGGTNPWNMETKIRGRISCGKEKENRAQGKSRKNSEESDGTRNKNWRVVLSFCHWELSSKLKVRCLKTRVINEAGNSWKKNSKRALKPRKKLERNSCLYCHQHLLLSISFLQHHVAHSVAGALIKIDMGGEEKRGEL